MTPEILALMKKLQPHFRKILEEMGGWKVGDRWGTISGKTGFANESGIHYGWYKNDRLWLPHPLDSDGEDGMPSKRCLWGMVDWDKFSDKFISTDGQFLVIKRRGEELHNIVSSPTLALLRALEKQWEVKNE